MSPALHAIVFGFVASAASMTLANELVYTPINPSFGGNPFNAQHLQFLATTQNQHLPDNDPITSSEASTADLFVRNLQSRLISGLAGQVADSIFGDNPSEEGTVVFGDTEVTFVRGAEFINLTINDPNSGLTEIQVPVLQVQ